ncbi:MAG: STAS domain-containing protein [Candidatus Omnitrophica bacterium]|nr:STAS domain-containing protein [Candidatus Omnitrophota bacterium]
MLRPKIIDTLKNYSWAQLRHDALAGVIVGIVALPLCIAFAIASGVSPDKGLITGIIAGFLISVLGGSRVQVGGPTGAFVVIIYDIVQKYGTDGLLVATAMGGVILCVMGLARFGSAIRFIPYPVVIGFTSGIAVIIFSSQVKDFLGLDIGVVPTEFFLKWSVYLRHINTVNPFAAALAAVTVAIVLFSRRLSRRIPGSFVAIVLTTLAVCWLDLPVDTIGSRFGDIPSQLPSPRLPHVPWSTVSQLLRPAFTIAMLAGIESLLSAVVADGMIGGKHRSNMELVAQGVANLVSPLFGGIPATGAIARTAMNVHSGGRTPVAGIVHSGVLLLIMLLFGRWAALIPLATLAGILVLVAYRMGEWHSFAMILKAPRSDVLVLVVTFFCTIVFDLTVAIEVGIVLAALLFIHRLSQTTSVNTITGFYLDEEDREDPDALSYKVIPRGAEVYEINGPFFFGMVSTFVETMNNVEKNPKARILRMRHVSSIDATAINALRQVVLQSRRTGVVIILSGVGKHLSEQLQRSGIVELVGGENIQSNIDKALERASQVVEERPGG